MFSARFALALAALSAWPALAGAELHAKAEPAPSAARSTPVPAPGGLWLFAAGLAALGIHLGRRRR
ncbi:MAG TPA: hypothetical protein VF702_04750 [Allosphingosinicella sp.]|jgi:hypothetical protein